MTTYNKSSTTLPDTKKQLKVHPPLIKGITSALFSIFYEGKYADKVVPALLKENPKWGSRDRKIVAQSTYDIVRYWRKYWHFIDSAPISDLGKIEELVLNYLSIHDYILPEEAKTYAIEKISDLKAIELAYPEWLVDRFNKELGEKWSVEADALNQPAAVYLRVNTSMIGVARAMDQLKDNKVDCKAVVDAPFAIELISKVKIDQLGLFKNGMIEIQDAGSQLIAPFLNPKKNSLIIDACAGSGGKTLHLADLTGNKSNIIATDIESWKLKNRLFRAEKSGFTTITTQEIPNGLFFEENAAKADYLLIDAPCSGLGVLKRVPDSKWKLSEERLEELIGIQKEILGNYHTLLKPGGQMVYATCSILPSENEDQVALFLQNNPNFKLIKQHTQLPSKGFDGFFMALLEKK